MLLYTFWFFARIRISPEQNSSAKSPEKRERKREGEAIAVNYPNIHFIYFL